MFKRYFERHFVSAALWFTLIISFVYLAVHMWIVTISSRSIYESLFFVALVACQLFLTFQGFHYFGHTLRVVNKKASDKDKLFVGDLPTLSEYPPVAIAVCSYKEPLQVIEDTLICFKNLTYPNKHLFLLDDTRYDKGDPEELEKYRSAVDALCADLEVNIFRRRWRGAKAGIINDFLDFLCNRSNPDFEITLHQKDKPSEAAEYLAIFDADMNPLPDFVETLVKKMQEDSKLAFVQTPQYYSNGYTNRVAHGASMQQTIFYEYICEGKSMREIMPCCGTNVLFRISALDEVGGMDESSVTEDLSTSLNLHIRGWKSEYLNHICAFGMGPNDLSGYFRQQFRWSSGSVGLLRSVFARFIKNPKSLNPVKWFEYSASVSYYCIGWIWMLLWLAPILYIFFGFPKALSHPEILMVVFLPYFACSFFIFIYSLVMKRHRIRDIFLGMTLNSICFPIYMKASLLGLLGFKGSFNITPKEGVEALPIWKLWPQLSAISVSVLAIVWAASHVYFGKWELTSMLPNMIWCAYNAFILSLVLYFNQPTKRRYL